MKLLQRMAFRLATIAWWSFFLLVAAGDPTWRRVGEIASLVYIGLYMSWALPSAIIESRRMMLRYRADKARERANQRDAEVAA